jgi:hypothetical protein
MKKQIEAAIKETLVISNKQSIYMAVDKIMKIIFENREIGNPIVWGTPEDLSVCQHKFEDLDINYVEGITICNKCHIQLEG